MSTEGEFSVLDEVVEAAPANSGNHAPTSAESDPDGDQFIVVDEEEHQENNNPSKCEDVPLERRKSKTPVMDENDVSTPIANQPINHLDEAAVADWCAVDELVEVEDAQNTWTGTTGNDGEEPHVDWNAVDELVEVENSDDDGVPEDETQDEPKIADQNNSGAEEDELCVLDEQLEEEPIENVKANLEAPGAQFSADDESDWIVLDEGEESKAAQEAKKPGTSGPKRSGRGVTSTSSRLSSRSSKSRPSDGKSKVHRPAQPVKGRSSAKAPQAKVAGKTGPSGAKTVSQRGAAAISTTVQKASHTITAKRRIPGLFEVVIPLPGAPGAAPKIDEHPAPAAAAPTRPFRESRPLQNGSLIAAAKEKRTEKSADTKPNVKKETVMPSRVPPTRADISPKNLVIRRNFSQPGSATASVREIFRTSFGKHQEIAVDSKAPLPPVEQSTRKITNVLSHQSSTHGRESRDHKHHRDSPPQTRKRKTPESNSSHKPKLSEKEVSIKGHRRQDHGTTIKPRSEPHPASKYPRTADPPGDAHSSVSRRSSKSSHPPPQGSENPERIRKSGQPSVTKPSQTTPTPKPKPDPIPAKSAPKGPVQEETVDRSSPKEVAKKPSPTVTGWVNSLCDLEYSVKKYTSFYCMPCREVLPTTKDWEEHLGTEEHRQNLPIWRHCQTARENSGKYLSTIASVQQDVNKIDGIATGADRIVELRSGYKKPGEQWLCVLCDAMCDSSKILLDHLQTYGHVDNHMRTVHPELYTPPFNADAAARDADAESAQSPMFKKPGAKEDLMFEVHRKAYEYMATRGKGRVKCLIEKPGSDHMSTEEFELEDAIVKGQMEELFTDEDKFMPQFRLLEAKSSVATKHREDYKTVPGAGKPRLPVGLQYMVEFWPPSRRCSPIYYCVMCDHVTKDIFGHCSAMKHTVSYYVKHYRSVYDMIVNEEGIKSCNDVRTGFEFAKSKILDLEDHQSKVVFVVQLEAAPEVFVPLNAAIAKKIVQELKLAVPSPPVKKRKVEPPPSPVAVPAPKKPRPHTPEPPRKQPVRPLMAVPISVPSKVVPKKVDAQTSPRAKPFPLFQHRSKEPVKREPKLPPMKHTRWQTESAPRKYTKWEPEPPPGKYTKWEREHTARKYTEKREPEPSPRMEKPQERRHRSPTPPRDTRHHGPSHGSGRKRAHRSAERSRPDQPVEKRRPDPSFRRRLSVSPVRRSSNAQNRDRNAYDRPRSPMPRAMPRKAGSNTVFVDSQPQPESVFNFEDEEIRHVEQQLTAEHLIRLQAALVVVGVKLDRPLTTGDLSMLRDRLGDDMVDRLLEQVCSPPTSLPARVSASAYPMSIASSAQNRPPQSQFTVRSTVAVPPPDLSVPPPLVSRASPFAEPSPSSFPVPSMFDPLAALDRKPIMRYHKTFPYKPSIPSIHHPRLPIAPLAPKSSVVLADRRRVILGSSKYGVPFEGR